MIPQRETAFWAPFSGSLLCPEGQAYDKYFLKDTPLAELERQMMTPPNFSPRGGGPNRPLPVPIPAGRRSLQALYGVPARWLYGGGLPLAGGACRGWNRHLYIFGR